MDPRIKDIISESIFIKHQVLEDVQQLDQIEKISDVCTIALKSDKKLLFCGNGGSAADAQHLAAELSGRFYLDRDPLFAEALHVDTSFMTAISNDYSFEEVYQRQIIAKGRTGDVLFGISTSGNSKNVLLAMEQARKQNLVTVGMTGATGGKMNGLCDFMIRVPSTDTPRIQEVHIMIGHIFCELIERNMFGK